MSHGGYVYAFKMYIFEKVRARNFARAWGFAQMAMSIPTLVGIPAASEYSGGEQWKTEPTLSHSPNSEHNFFTFSVPQRRLPPLLGIALRDFAGCRGRHGGPRRAKGPTT